MKNKIEEDLLSYSMHFPLSKPGWTSEFHQTAQGLAPWSSEALQGEGFHSLPRQPVPVLNHSQKHLSLSIKKEKGNNLIATCHYCCLSFHCVPLLDFYPVFFLISILTTLLPVACPGCPSPCTISAVTIAAEVSPYLWLSSKGLIWLRI